MASCCLTQYDHDYVFDPFSKIRNEKLQSDFDATTCSDIITCCTDRNNFVKVQTNIGNGPCRRTSGLENQRKFHCVTYPKTKQVNTAGGVKTFNVTTISPLELSRLLKFYNAKNLKKNDGAKIGAASDGVDTNTTSARVGPYVVKANKRSPICKNVIIKTLASPNNKKTHLQSLKWHHTSFEPKRNKRKEIKNVSRKCNSNYGRQRTVSPLPWPVTPLSQALDNLEARDLAVKETVSCLNNKSESIVKFENTDPVLSGANSCHEPNEGELNDVISVSVYRKRRQSDENFEVPLKSRKVVSEDGVLHDPGFFEGSASQLKDTSKMKMDSKVLTNLNSSLNKQEFENLDSNILPDDVFLDLFGCDTTKLLNDVCNTDAIMQENMSILDMVFEKPVVNNNNYCASMSTSENHVPMLSPNPLNNEPKAVVIEPEEFLATSGSTSGFSSDFRRSSIDVSPRTSSDFNGLSDTDSGIHSPGSNSGKFLSDLGRSYSSNSETGSITGCLSCNDNEVFYKGKCGMCTYNTEDVSQCSKETSLLDLDDNKIHIKSERPFFIKSEPFTHDIGPVTSFPTHDVTSFVNQEKYVAAKMVTVPKWKVSLSLDSRQMLASPVTSYSGAVKTEQFEMECAGVNPTSHCDLAVGNRIRKLTSCEKGKSIHLWEFIRDVLLNPQHCPSLIKWEDREKGVFKFMQSDAIASMWGKRKQNPKMTYEKLSRAMRYYYNRGILERVDGRRLVYKFGPNSYGWRNTNPKQHQSAKKLSQVINPKFPVQTCQVKIEQRPMTPANKNSNGNNNKKTLALKTFSIPLTTSSTWEMTSSPMSSSDHLASLPSPDVFLCKQIKLATGV